MNPLVTTGLDPHRGTTALSVNLNKVALVRNTRPLGIPSVVHAATIALEAGAQDRQGGENLGVAVPGHHLGSDGLGPQAEALQCPPLDGRREVAVVAHGAGDLARRAVDLAEVAALGVGPQAVALDDVPCGERFRRKVHESPEGRNEKGLRRSPKPLWESGGRCRDRTCDPWHVRPVLSR